MGDYRLALDYQKSLKEISDSLFTVDQNKQLAKIQMLYETEKKEKLIVKQDRDIIALEANKEEVEMQRNYLIWSGLLLLILAFIAFKFYQIRKERNDKVEFTEALLYAQEEERKRIARDLHDGVGQSLLLMKRQLKENHSVTLENRGMISDTLEEIRAISRDLHPFQLEQFGLTSAIENAFENVEQSTGLFISKEVDNIDDGLSAKAQIHVFRVVQEAMNNIVKHAEATAAKLVLQSNADKVIISIQDNGKGFDHGYATEMSKSLGLRTMYERVSAVGGKLIFAKNQDKGTFIKIIIPKDM